MGYKPLTHPYYSHYKVDERGRVRNWKTKRPLKPLTASWGYHYVELHKTINGERKRKVAYIHRLVMEVHNPKNFNAELAVHHIDGNMHNNKVDNLICVTTKEHALLHYGDKSYGI